MTEHRRVADYKTTTQRQGRRVNVYIRPALIPWWDSIPQGKRSDVISTIITAHLERHRAIAGGVLPDDVAELKRQMAAMMELIQKGASK